MPDYKIGGKRGLPLDADRPFDRQAAADSMFAAAGWPDNPDPAKARRGFVVYEADADASLKGSYHLPFARVVDGTLKAVPNGVRNAKSRLPQLGGVSQDVVDRGNALLDSYMERIQEEADGGDGRAASAGPVVTFEHHIRAVGRAQTGHSREELLSRAELRAPDPAVFDENAPFFWSVDGSSNKRDTFGTFMQVSTLRNYAADAEDGVAFLRVHNDHQLNFGWSLAGKFTGGQGNGVARMAADFFTLRDIELEGLQTNAFIQLARAGIAHDVSVSFYDGRMMCSLPFCGKRMMDFRSMLSTLANGDDSEFCWHVPLVEYAVPDQKGKPTRQREVAFGLIEDARLGHIGWVPAGSNPDASLTATRNVAVLKAWQAADAHKLDPEQARMFESHHRGLHLPSYHNWPGYRPPVDADGRSHADEESPPPVDAAASTIDRKQTIDKPSVSEPTKLVKEVHMGDITITARVFEQIRTLLPDEQANQEDASAVVGALVARYGEMAASARAAQDAKVELEQLRPLKVEVEELRPLAESGRKARARLIKAALDEGVRAYSGESETFDREAKQTQLERMTDEDIQMFHDAWAKVAGPKFPGGRLTDDSRPEQFGGSGGQNANGRAASTPVYRD